MTIIAKNIGDREYREILTTNCWLLANIVGHVCKLWFAQVEVKDGGEYWVI